MNSKKIVDLEKTAMDRWGKGDPTGFLEISSDDVTYFDPFLEKKLTGKQGLTELYETIKGQVFIDNYEMLNLSVQESGNVFILTYNFVSYFGSNVNKWNCTEVFTENEEELKIIHTHWSFTKP